MRVPVKSLAINPPKQIRRFLEDPPLVGSERLEDYNAFFAAIAASVKPVDAIDWLFTKDVVELSWHIRRERAIVADVVKLAQKQVVLALLKATCDTSGAAETALYRIFDAADDADRWASGPKGRRAIDARLAEKGHPPSAILAQAYINAAPQIDAVDKRIAGYEMRRIAVLKEVERRSEKLARGLDKSSSDIIDGEFSVAAE
jgi:hypothetical protein